MITTRVQLVIFIFWTLCYILLFLLIISPSVLFYLFYTGPQILVYSFVIFECSVFCEMFVVLSFRLRMLVPPLVYEERSQHHFSLDAFTVRWLAIRSPTWQATISKECCPSCSKILRQSRLLRGCWTTFVPAQETYVYNDYLVEETESESRLKSCYLCSLLWSTLQIRQHAPTEQDSILPTYYPKNYGYDTISSTQNGMNGSCQPLLHIFEAVGTEGTTHLRLSVPGYSSPAFTVFTDLNRSIQNDVHCVSANTGTSDVAQCVQQWIHACTEHHPECQATTPYRPRRLLALLEEDKVQLVDARSSLDIDVEYIALSHCWGPDGVPLRLTGETQEALFTSFDVSILPQNFRDAVEFTRKLRYSYIWIDSLCIMQDSANDTRSEIVAMSEIYSGAVCTIAATVSTGPNGGCFRNRIPSRYANFELMGSDLSYDYLSPRAPEQSLTIFEFFASKVEPAPLNQRAWTFQERLLSRRVIHFCSNEVAFECSHMCASEWHRDGTPYPRSPYVRLDGRLYTETELQTLKQTHPEYINKPYISRLRIIGRSKPMVIRRDSWEPNPQATTARIQREHLVASSARNGIRGALDMLQTLPTDLSQAEKLECHRRWYELVAAYSARSMTYRSDRLRALAGLIELISKKTEMVNFAGLWETTLAFDLLWSPMSSLKAPPEVHIAPSWSWASVDGQVVSLLQSFTAASGEVDGGERESKVHVETEVRATGCFEGKKSPVSRQMYADFDICLSIRGPLKRVRLGEVAWKLDYEDSDADAKATCLLVYSESNNADSHAIRWAGLILKAVDGFGCSCTVYRRIGSVVTDSPYDWVTNGWETDMIKLV